MPSMSSPTIPSKISISSIITQVFVLCEIGANSLIYCTFKKLNYVAFTIHIE